MKYLLAALALASFSLSFADDMQKYLSVTRGLVKEGKQEEALERMIWFHEHALEHDESMYGVRLSFALSDWKSLGESYPPALIALMKTRADKTTLIREGKGSRDLFHDVLALNQTLEEPDQSVALFEFVSDGEPARAAQYWDLAKDVILEQKRYDIARKYIKDVGEDVKDEFVNAKKRYDDNVTLSKDPRFGGDQFKKHNQDNFFAESQKLIELALALGDRDAAVGVRDSALEVIDDPRLKGLIPENE